MNGCPYIIGHFCTQYFYHIGGNKRPDLTAHIQRIIAGQAIKKPCCI